MDEPDETGYIIMTGTEPQHLAKLPIALIDVLAAHQLKEGILLALMRRSSDGRGAFVEVSLEEAALSGLINQASNQLMCGHVAAPIGTLHPTIAPYGELFVCQDGGRIILAVGSDAQFNGLCAVLDLHALAADERFGNNRGRVMHRAALAGELAPAIARHQRDGLLTALRDAQVPAGAVRSIHEVMRSTGALDMTLSSPIDGRMTHRIRGNAFRISDLYAHLAEDRRVGPLVAEGFLNAR